MEYNIVTKHILEWERLSNNGEVDRALAYYMEHSLWNHNREYFTLIRKRKKINKSKRNEYMYMGTFTLDPSKVDIENENDLKKVQKYLLHRLSLKGLRLNRCDWVREGTDKDNKHPHWHVGMISERCIKKSFFYKYLRDYGNIKIDISISSDYNHILSYINKTHISVSLFEHC